MPENPKQKKGSNSGAMLEKPKKKNEGIESGHDARDPKQKKGSNSSTMPEKPKQNEGIESEHDA